MVSALSGTGVNPLFQPRNSRNARASGQDGTAADNPAVQAEVRELQQIDLKIRQHEQAHQAAGGSYAGGANFTYTKGPDGKNYATAGEVPIDISPEQDPRATIRKMETVKSAALAPSDPSPQDLRVAQQADAIKAQAQQELRTQENAILSEGGGGSGGSASPEGARRGAAAYGAAARIGTEAARAGPGLLV